jgi:hypothetical protein
MFLQNRVPQLSQRLSCRLQPLHLVAANTAPKQTQHQRYQGKHKIYEPAPSKQAAPARLFTQTSSSLQLRR